MSSTTEALLIAPPAFGKTRILLRWQEQATEGRRNRTRLFEALQHPRSAERLILRINGRDADKLERELRDCALRLGISLRGLVVKKGPITAEELRDADQKHPLRARPYIGPRRAA